MNLLVGVDLKAGMRVLFASPSIARDQKYEEEQAVRQIRVRVPICPYKVPKGPGPQNTLVFYLFHIFSIFPFT